MKPVLGFNLDIEFMSLCLVFLLPSTALVYLPKLYVEFTEEQFLSIFAIAVPYTNPFRYVPLADLNKIFANNDRNFQLYQLCVQNEV